MLLSISEIFTQNPTIIQAIGWNIMWKYQLQRWPDGERRDLKEAHRVLALTYDNSSLLFPAEATAFKKKNKERENCSKWYALEIWGKFHKQFYLCSMYDVDDHEFESLNGYLTNQVFSNISTLNINKKYNALPSPHWRHPYTWVFPPSGLAVARTISSHTTSPTI